MVTGELVLYLGFHQNKYFHENGVKNIDIKGGVPIIKMENSDGFFHEGEGGLELYIRILKNDFKKTFRIIP